MKYSIKKDAHPLDTIARIRRILKEVDIDLEVSCSGKGKYHCSYRIDVLNTEIGTNGKGTNEKNALASAYAEFMERLQNDFLFEIENPNFLYQFDEKIEKLSNLEKSGLAKEIKNFNLDLNFINKIALIRMNERQKERIIKEFKKDETITVPFVSYKNKKLNYLPYFLIRYMQGSNGMAAGNTYEEAMVQGLSEIIERHCCVEIFRNNLKLPVVPIEYYEKYDSLMKLIREVESYGYKITIKDASLGKNFPTICTIFEDIKYPKNGVCINFGAQPYLPIAIERTLTEFLQGRRIANRISEKFIQITSDISKQHIVSQFFNKAIFFKKNNKHIQNILSDKFDYKFNPDTWENNEDADNKTMLTKLAKNILKYTDDIYIRNNTFLDFPAVYIYIPHLSNKQLDSGKYFREMNQTSFNKNSTIEETYKCAQLQCDYNFNSQGIKGTVQGVECGHLGLYCALIMKNKKNTFKFIKKIIRQQCLADTSLENRELMFYQGLNKYLKMHYSKVPEETIEEKIKKQYGENIYFDIKDILKVHSIQLEKEETINKQQDSLSDYDIMIKDIEQKIFKAYMKNKPDQNEILKILGKPKKKFWWF